MATAPKETSLIVRDLERDLRDEERILHDLERDLRRDADVLKQLEWDVAELGRTVPEAPTRKGNKGATIALAIVSGAVILAAGFGIGMAVQNVTTSNVRDDLTAAEAAQQVAADQLATAEALDTIVAAALGVGAAAGEPAQPFIRRMVAAGATVPQATRIWRAEQFRPGGSQLLGSTVPVVAGSTTAAPVIGADGIGGYPGPFNGPRPTSE